MRPRTRLPLAVTTERLVLRPISPFTFALQTLHWTKDRQAMSDLFLETEGWTLVRWWKYLRKMSRKRRFCHGVWPKAGGPPIGVHFVSPISPSGDVTIGIIIGERDWRGGGVAAEAKSAMIDDLFERCGVNRISSWVYSRNFSSVHMALQLGFKREAVIRETVLLRDGTLGDFLGFGLLRSEWQALRSRSVSSIQKGE